jgi:hypothetical protein
MGWFSNFIHGIQNTEHKFIHGIQNIEHKVENGIHNFEHKAVHELKNDYSYINHHIIRPVVRNVENGYEKTKHQIHAIEHTIENDVHSVEHAVMNGEKAIVNEAKLIYHKIDKSNLNPFNWDIKKYVEYAGLVIGGIIVVSLIGVLKK